jgi:hypothetical protein
MKFVEYFKHFNIYENQMVKISYMYDESISESFWVWVQEIDDNFIKGIICNDLKTDDLKLGQVINFKKIHIKETANRFYTLEETLKSIEISKKNIIAKLLNEANINYINLKN